MSLRESKKEPSKEILKEIIPTKKQLQPVVRYRKSTKNQPPLEVIQENVSEIIHDIKVNIEKTEAPRNESPPNKFVEVYSKISYIEAEILNLKQGIIAISSPKFNDKQHNFLQKKYDNGNTYIGEFFGSHKDGRGKFIWANGDSYEGEWKNDKQNGKGKST